MKSYKEKIREELLKCNTQQEVDVVGARYLDKINNWSTGIKLALVGTGFGVLGYQILKSRGYLPSDSPNIPYADKGGHFAKGLLTSAIVGWLHDKIDDLLERPADADDVIRNRARHIFERSVLEGGLTITEAFAWEWLQAKWPPFPGSAFDTYDAVADFIGHCVNWGVNAYYARKMVILYNEIMKRKKELHDSGKSLCKPGEIKEQIPVIPITKPGRFVKSLDDYFNK